MEKHFGLPPKLKAEAIQLKETVGYFDTDEGVDQYIEMAEGYDGRELIETLRSYAPSGSSVLELGMGPGKDLALLEPYFRATGSDSSAVFVDRYRALESSADVLVLEALRFIHFGSVTNSRSTMICCFSSTRPRVFPNSWTSSSKCSSRSSTRRWRRMTRSASF